ncbi:DUF397 domain-containing protein [Streptomyces sp. NPDC057910]|uniref:DUF397 domain-containing protein n=1 Tax=Streptomyces sp. NPDC057910 TaxID=3346278 RepID=UPI0036E71EA0
MTHTTALHLAPASAWRKSSYSNDGSGNCVEVAELVATAAVRDSKEATGPALVLSDSARGFFLDAVKHRTI